jgi:hypothetical protein
MPQWNATRPLARTASRSVVQCRPDGFVRCSMAAVLAIGGPMPAGDAQVTMPASEGLLDRHVFRASRHEPLTRKASLQGF